MRGAALADKAADGLQTSVGISGRTLHWLEYAWQKGRDSLTARDILVIDEAGMIGSRQLGQVLGDAQQLQPSDAGAAFRAIAEQERVAEISAVR